MIEKDGKMYLILQAYKTGISTLIFPGLDAKAGMKWLMAHQQPPHHQPQQIQPHRQHQKTSSNKKRDTIPDSCVFWRCGGVVNLPTEPGCFEFAELAPYRSNWHGYNVTGWFSPEHSPHPTSLQR